MSGLFGGGSRAPTQAEIDADAARQKAASRAESEEITQMQGVQSRRSRMRRGGLRLLFSPARREGPQQEKLKTNLGGDSS